MKLDIEARDDLSAKRPTVHSEPLRIWDMGGCEYNVNARVLDHICAQKPSLNHALKLERILGRDVRKAAAPPLPLSDKPSDMVRRLLW